jgi:hypothetical protein
VKKYSSANTGLLIVDPYNDMISEGGKLWSSTKETVKGVNLIENLKNLYYLQPDPLESRLYTFRIVRLKRETIWTGSSARLHTRAL